MNILIVDDSRAMRMIVGRTVRQAVGECTIREAGNGLEGLAAIREQRPDLVLCDWNMPEMSGYELLCALKKEPVTPPFGFVTSECTPEIRAQALAEGARFFIVKPFTADSFRAAVVGLIPS